MGRTGQVEETAANTAVKCVRQAHHAELNDLEVLNLFLYFYQS